LRQSALAQLYSRVIVVLVVVVLAEPLPPFLKIRKRISNTTPAPTIHTHGALYHIPEVSISLSTVVVVLVVVTASCAVAVMVVITNATNNDAISSHLLYVF
jgi:hypothetical protein